MEGGWIDEGLEYSREDLHLSAEEGDEIFLCKKTNLGLSGRINEMESMYLLLEIDVCAWIEFILTSRWIEKLSNDTAIGHILGEFMHNSLVRYTIFLLFAHTTVLISEVP